MAAPPPEVAVRAGFAERLAGAIRLPTISNQDADLFDGDAFTALHDHLAEHFPGVHSTLTREVVGRILPGDSAAGVLARVQRVVNDPTVEIHLAEDAWEPSPISPIDAAGYRTIERTIHQLVRALLI